MVLAERHGSGWDMEDVGEVVCSVYGAVYGKAGAQGSHVRAEKSRLSTCRAQRCQARNWARPNYGLVVLLSSEQV